MLKFRYITQMGNLAIGLAWIIKGFYNKTERALARSVCELRFNLSAFDFILLRLYFLRVFHPSILSGYIYGIRDKLHRSYFHHTFSRS
jgi:hypothetical protein